MVPIICFSVRSPFTQSYYCIQRYRMNYSKLLKFKIIIKSFPTNRRHAMMSSEIDNVLSVIQSRRIPPSGR